MTAGIGSLQPATGRTPLPRPKEAPSISATHSGSQGHLNCTGRGYTGPPEPTEISHSQCSGLTAPNPACSPAQDHQAAQQRRCIPQEKGNQGASDHY